jgi:hypothetical protein
MNSPVKYSVSALIWRTDNSLQSEGDHDRPVSDKGEKAGLFCAFQDKIRQVFGIQPPKWRDSLRRYFESIYMEKTGGGK